MLLVAVVVCRERLGLVVVLSPSGVIGGGVQVVLVAVLVGVVVGAFLVSLSVEIGVERDVWPAVDTVLLPPSSSPSTSFSLLVLVVVLGSGDGACPCRVA